MKQALAFDDVLILPKFSDLASRKEANVKNLIISSNMDTITESAMAIAMYQNSQQGALHRFMTIDQNREMLEKVFQGDATCYVSFGLGDKELERVKSLYNIGARKFILDVAHGANMNVVIQYNDAALLLPNSEIVVGNFATKEETQEFLKHVIRLPDAIKVGVGSGSMCTTRIVTGCGLPTFQSILDIAPLGIPVIADGGIKNSGDIAKALAAGASKVMIGSLLSGTEETPGELVNQYGESASDNLKKLYSDSSYESMNIDNNLIYKKYRGSASRESYIVQGKEDTHRTAEGEATTVPYKGSVTNVLQELEAGLRSAFSYVGARNLKEFHERARLSVITSASNAESKAHGVK